MSWYCWRPKLFPEFADIKKTCHGHEPLLQMPKQACFFDSLKCNVYGVYLQVRFLESWNICYQEILRLLFFNVYRQESWGVCGVGSVCIHRFGKVLHHLSYLSSSLSSISKSCWPCKNNLRFRTQSWRCPCEDSKHHIIYFFSYFSYFSNIHFGNISASLISPVDPADRETRSVSIRL